MSFDPKRDAPMMLRTTCVCGAVHEAPCSEGLVYHQTVQFFLHAHHACIEQHWQVQRASVKEPST